MPRPISATISLPSLSHNLGAITQQLSSLSKENTRPTPKVWAVIKANAYGHGIEPAVRAFADADGLALLDLNEAVLCREAGWTKPILLLEGCFEPADLSVAADYSLAICIHSEEQLRMLESSNPPKPVDSVVKLNTGMNRLGFASAEFASAYRRALDLVDRAVLASVGKMTHLARADDSVDVTLEQLQLFALSTLGLPGDVSVCNSAGTLTPQYWLNVPSDAPQWVRPGICLYGSSPFASQSADDLGLKPAMTLHSRIIGVQQVQAGSGMGYGHAFVAPQDMRIGVVACGYADGYPRHAPTGTPVSVEGVRTRLLGRVSMDMLIVDLTPVPQAAVGSPVVLWGEGGPSVDEVARAAGTIGYELLCALAPRVPKNIKEIS